MVETCHLAGPFRQCCCNCKHHLQDFHHCTTAWDMRESHGGCVCSVPKGWICYGTGRAHSGWPEHSIGCEMYSPVKKHADAA